MLQNAFVSSRWDESFIRVSGCILHPSRLTCIGLTKKESRGAFDTSVEDQFSTRYLVCNHVYRFSLL